MRTTIIFFIALFGLFFYANQTQAAGPTDQEIKARYSGSILMEDNNFERTYWYVELESTERYRLKDGISVSRLLKKFAEEISPYDLNKIAINADSLNVDYKLTHQLKGKFLRVKGTDNDFWFVNPIDGYRYQIANGKDGFSALQKLALDISPGKIRVIDVTDNANFSASSKEINFTTYEKIPRIFKYNYYRSDLVDNKDLFYGSLKGMAAALNDKYTEFFTPDKKQNFEDLMEGSVEGIGAIVETIDGVLNIISPLDDSPAAKAGLLPNDQVLSVDGVDIHGYSVDKSIGLIKGRRGTTVVLEIYRPDTNETFFATIIRKKVEIPNITAKELDNNIAYIKIGMFTVDTKSKFDLAKNEIINNQTKGLIIDLRNNPGGYTDTAAYLVDYWLPENSVILKEKFPNKIRQYTASRPQEIDLPTVLLVNRGTGSAAEIFTSSLQYHDKAKIVGDQTFGKGTGQTMQNFIDGSALKYTFLEWFTPGDVSVEGVGITPDFVIKDRNEQLQKAKDLLK